MGSKKDLTGLKFGRLLVIGEEFVRKGKKILWKCTCDCGNVVSVIGQSLTDGGTQSCGCLQRERASTANFIHGATQGNKKTLYVAWESMKKRVYNTSDKRYHRYGGRGIKVCDEWLHDYERFEKDILAVCPNDYLNEDGTDIARYMSIERIDVDGNYEPSNCTVIPVKNQAWNTRRNVFVLLDGEKCHLEEAYRRLNVNSGSIENLAWMLKIQRDEALVLHVFRHNMPHVIKRYIVQKSNE